MLRTYYYYYFHLHHGYDTDGVIDDGCDYAVVDDNIDDGGDDDFQGYQRNGTDCNNNDKIFSQSWRQTGVN